MYRALHRLLAPRHPPCALSSFNRHMEKLKFSQSYSTVKVRDHSHAQRVNLWRLVTWLQGTNPQLSKPILELIIQTKTAWYARPFSTCIPYTPYLSHHRHRRQTHSSRELPQRAAKPCSCGDEGARTPGLLRAREALSHLSYIPLTSGPAWTRTRDHSLIRGVL